MRIWFWHPPKTAGATIWVNLNAINKSDSPVKYAQPRSENMLRMTPEEIEFVRQIKSMGGWSKHLPVQRTVVAGDVPSILSVRDPYPRVLSFWSYYVKHHNRAVKKVPNPENYPARSFDSWVREYITHPKLWYPWRPCAFWYHHLQGTVDIIRVENLEEDYKRVTGHDLKVGFESDNATVGWTRETALDFLNPTQVNLINEMFHEDFEIFGYEKFNKNLI